MAADLGVNNGPNESTALAPQLYDVLQPGTRNETIALLKRLTAQPAGSPRRDRVELLGMGFEWPNAGMVHGFDHTLGYNPLRLEEFSEAVGTRDGIASPSERKFTPLFPSYRCRLANLLGLRYIASPVPIERIDQALGGGDLNLVARTKEGYVYENPRALPRVMLLTDWQLADFGELLRSGWPGVDPRRIVLLEKAPAGFSRRAAVGMGGSARLVRYANTEVVVEAAAPGGGILLFNDVWHPWWRASVDGAAADILKADVMFRAVVVPRGRHVVRFSFHPFAGALGEIVGKVKRAH